VHWGKFSLSLHAWDEPVTRIACEAKRKGMDLIHPMIGEAVYLDQNIFSSEWWK
jgi:hypothetical protein